MKIPGVDIELTDYKNRVFDTEPFWADRDPAHGPGWFVWGREKNRVIKRVARPDVPERRHPHYNIRVRAGWKRKSDAQAVAAKMTNELYRQNPVARRSKINVIVKDHTGRVLFRDLIYNGGNVMRFKSGYGFVTVDEAKRNHWTIWTTGARPRQKNPVRRRRARKKID